MAGRKPVPAPPTQEDGSLAFPFYLDGPEHLRDFLSTSRGGEWAVYWRGKAFSLERARRYGTRLIDAGNRAGMVMRAYEQGLVLPFQRRNTERPDLFEYLVYVKKEKGNAT